MERMNLTVEDEDKEWLEENPQINASGLLQKAIDLERKIQDGELGAKTMALQGDKFDDGFEVPELDDDVKLVVSGCLFGDDLRIPRDVVESGRCGLYGNKFHSGAEAVTYENDGDE